MRNFLSTCVLSALFSALLFSLPSVLSPLAMAAITPLVCTMGLLILGALVASTWAIFNTAKQEQEFQPVPNIQHHTITNVTRIVENAFTCILRSVEEDTLATAPTVELPKLGDLEIMAYIEDLCDQFKAQERSDAHLDMLRTRHEQWKTHQHNKGTQVVDATWYIQQVRLQEQELYSS